MYSHLKAIVVVFFNRGGAVLMKVIHFYLFVSFFLGWLGVSVIRASNLRSWGWVCLLPGLLSFNSGQVVHTCASNHQAV